MGTKIGRIEVEGRNGRTRSVPLVRCSCGAEVVRDALTNVERGGQPCREAGDKDLLDREYVSVTWARGRGGKPWAAFETADGVVVRYFPAGRFGPFVTSKEGGAR